MSRPDRAARSTRRLWAVRALVAIVLLGAFVAVTSMYDAEGQVTQVGGAAATGGFVATVSPVSINPATGYASVRVAISNPAPQYVDATGRLAAATRITIVTDSGVAEERFPAGTVPGAMTVDAGLDGDLALYPFDDHHGSIVVVVDRFRTQDDGSVVSDGDIPVTLVADGGMAGWMTTLTVPTEPQAEARATMTFERTFSTRVFALLVVSMSVALAALSLTIGLLVRFGRRVVEATLLSWGAALLFALPAMRNFLPGSPPIGVALDVYVFLWVMGAAVLAAILLAVAWIARDRPQA